MSSGIVFDASTAILLARVGLLESAVEGIEATMAERAFEEAVDRESDDARLIRALAERGRISLVRARDTARIRKDFVLDEGEAQTILVARALGAVCATDDGPAIRCCKVLGVPFATAIQFVVKSRKSGALSEELALEALEKLQRFGRYNVRFIEDAARRIRRATSRGKGGQP